MTDDDLSGLANNIDAELAEEIERQRLIASGGVGFRAVGWVDVQGGVRGDAPNPGAVPGDHSHRLRACPPSDMSQNDDSGRVIWCPVHPQHCGGSGTLCTEKGCVRWFVLTHERLAPDGRVHPPT